MRNQANYTIVDRARLEIIYKALCYVVHTEKVEMDKKHRDMWNALQYSFPETDVTDIPIVMGEIYEALLNFEDVKERLLFVKGESEDF